MGIESAAMHERLTTDLPADDQIWPGLDINPQISSNKIPLSKTL